MLEIERKYLVEEGQLPDNLQQYAHRDITQCYIAIAESGREVRLRTHGEKCFLTVKDGGGRTRFEAQVEISEQQRLALWPAAVGHRIEKTRFEIPYSDCLIELDVYAGDLSGLITAEVEFTSQQASEDFCPPQWFGPDVTEDERFKNQNLSQHGLPTDLPQSDTLQQASAVPVRRREGQLQICLITTLKKGNWCFPKGIIDPGETYIETAVKEVYEEAGLRGNVVPEPLGSYQDAKWGKQLEITVVLFDVTSSDKSWPEAEVRERKWVVAEEARRLLANSPLERFVRLAERRLGEEEGTEAVRQ